MNFSQYRSKETIQSSQVSSFGGHRHDSQQVALGLANNLGIDQPNISTFDLPYAQLT